jgi:hypothetical protein
MKSMHQSNIFSLRFSHKTERVYSAGNDQRLLVHDIRLFLYLKKILFLGHLDDFALIGLLLRFITFQHM